MVADAPDDKTQWLDPDPIMLGDVPSTDMTERAAKAAPFIKHLEKALGRKVLYYVGTDYPDLVTAFRANRVHVLILNTGSVVQSVRCEGYVPIAQPVDSQGNVGGSHMELIVPAKSTIKAPQDLRGHRLTFVDQRSNNGYKAPRAILAKEFGLLEGKDYSFDFSGRHDNSILGVANGSYEAASVANDIRARIEREGLIDPASIRVIYKSRIFPLPPWGVSNRLDPALVARVRDAMVSYRGPIGLLQVGDRFRAADFKNDWAAMRDISAASETANCK